MEVNFNKNLKELEIILSSFECDKHCPYCTAKTTKWPKVDDDITMLSLNVGQLKKLGYTFRYVTIGGNGEPTKHSLEKLKTIVEMFDGYDIPIKRVLTSGNVFRPEEKAKYDMFVNHNWMFEVTTTTFDHLKDRETLGYNHTYFNTEAFRNARIRLNYVLLKRNIDTFISDINNFFKEFPNIETIGLKLLNINTKDGDTNNQYSKWILENAIPKDDREVIANILNNNFKYNGESYDTFSWDNGYGREVYFSWKKSSYGLYDLVYYGDRFVNYQLEDSDKVKLVPKVYIASRFIKSEKMVCDLPCINFISTLSLSKDFRSSLIGEDNLLNFNNESLFKVNDRLYQYVGPFYNEKASDGQLTDECISVVNSENNLIKDCDIFVTYLDETPSLGSITELMYAASLGKEIYIYYKINNDIKGTLKTSNWFPILTVQNLYKDKVHIRPVK